VVYALSYPRSGKSWFRYCFDFITEASSSDSELLYHSHWQSDHDFKIENNFDIKNILLLRNYKEAIFSELANIYNKKTPVITAAAAIDRKLDQRQWLTLSSLMRFQRDLLGPVAMTPQLQQEVWEKFADQPKPPTLDTPRYQQQVVLNFAGVSPHVFEHVACELEIGKLLSDFFLDSAPTIPNPDPPALPLSSEIGNFEQIISDSLVCHYHLALQLRRYHDLLEYHDKISKKNPNNALMVKYEDFMQNPFLELSRVIDFLGTNKLTSSDDIKRFRDNLNNLVDNIYYHKSMSYLKYRSSGHLALTQAFPLAENDGWMCRFPPARVDKSGNYYSSKCRKEFLTGIDDVLKNKNLELFEKYLSGYEERYLSSEDCDLTDKDQIKQ